MIFALSNIKGIIFQILNSLRIEFIRRLLVSTATNEFIGTLKSIISMRYI